MRTATVKLTGAGEELSYSGKVRGRYESQLAFQVNGKIIKRDVELGSTVKTGQILMQLDPIDIQQGVNSAKAQLASAESQFQLAKDNLDRFQKLYTDRLLSKAEFDNYRNAYEMATAGLNQARAQYTDASNKYNYCFLSANASGVIAAVNAEVGQVIGAGQPVVTLIRDGEKELEIQVPENRLEEIRDAKRLEVTFWALSNVKITGKIREVAPMADPASGTYRMRISLMNPPAELKLGMTATVRMADDEQTKMLYIPLSAIIQTGDSPGVWVVNEGLIRLRQVTLGSFGDDRVQVTEGLNAGERVVIAGVHKLQAGQKVRLGDDAQ
ncbi:efflux RND transporter periplasmic adaptor subunit [Hydrogenispora ethanolica]|uniref:efflux RND transporter periplasmic adaptor subunit n=1 Tax=Hydrogenispora ethanolica TaxID=1082276 RepID=UPI001FB416DB|nr:efflux RND transporter periplasmic adaptor subunit [Hydrogenispora ethanolica]